MVLGPPLIMDLTFLFVSSLPIALSIKANILVWPNRNVVEGDHLEVNCTVSGSNSGVHMLLLTNKWHQEGNNTVIRRLTAKPQDSGRYECILTTGNVRKTASANVSVTGEDDIFFMNF